MDRELARVKDVDLWIEDHGMLIMSATFDYGSSQQGLGFAIDEIFIYKFMQVFGVEFLKQVNGKPCWVTHDWHRIYKIEPLMEGEGKPFEFEQWANWLKKEDRSMSPSQIGDLDFTGNLK